MRRPQPGLPERHPAIKDRTARIRYVAALMASNEFHRRCTVRELAKAWQIPIGTAYGITSEASRLIQNIVDPVEIKGVVHEMTAHMCRKVYELDDELNDNRDPFRSAMLALKVCDVQFMFLRTTRDDSLTDPFARLAEMSDDELTAEVDRVDVDEAKEDIEHGPTCRP